MSIENVEVVDFISIGPAPDEVVLTVSDHLRWGDPEHLFLIQEKINSYLSFVEGGQILEDFPKAEGKSVRIEFVCKYPPDEDGIGFLDRCREVTLGAGIDMTYRHQPAEDPDSL